MSRVLKQGDDFAQYLFHQETNFASSDGDAPNCLWAS